jgi:hypothetical protein
MEEVELRIVVGRVFIYTSITFNASHSESGKLLHLSLLMFLVECGRKWNTA